MSTHKKYVIVTNLNYNKDSYYLVRFTVRDKSRLLKNENGLTNYGKAVKASLDRVNRNHGRARMVTYAITPYFVQFVVCLKQITTDITVKDSRTFPMFLKALRKLTEDTAESRIWQEDFAYRKISGKKMLMDEISITESLKCGKTL